MLFIFSERLTFLGIAFLMLWMFFCLILQNLSTPLTLAYLLVKLTLLVCFCVFLRAVIRTTGWPLCLGLYYRYFINRHCSWNKWWRWWWWWWWCCGCDCRQKPIGWKI